MAFTVTAIPGAIQYTKNEIIVSIAGSSPDALFRLDLLRINNSLITSLEGRLGSDHAFSWDLSEILDAMAQHTTYGIGSFQHDQKVVFHYKFTITEVSDQSAGLNLYSSVELRAIKGGIAQGFITDPFIRMAENKRFLTHSDNLTILPNQICILDFLYLNPAISNLTAKAKLFYTDGSSYSLTLGNWEDWEPYNIIRINAGFRDNLLDMPFPDRTVSHYLITVENGSRIYGSMIIRLDHAFYRNPVIFLYANSLGGIDTAYLSGKNQFTLKPEIQQAEKQAANGSKRITYNHILSREIETSTGYKSKKDIESLAEIFLTPFVYEFVNNSLIPISIDPSSSLITDLSSNLNAATIKYSRSFSNRCHTPDSFDVKN